MRRNNEGTERVGSYNQITIRKSKSGVQRKGQPMNYHNASNMADSTTADTAMSDAANCPAPEAP